MPLYTERERRAPDEKWGMSSVYRRSVARGRVSVLPGHETIESLLEPGQASASVNQVLPPAGPRRMRGRIDFEGEFGARLPEG